MSSVSLNTESVQPNPMVIDDGRANTPPTDLSNPQRVYRLRDESLQKALGISNTRLIHLLRITGILKSSISDRANNQESSEEDIEQCRGNPGFQDVVRIDTHTDSGHSANRFLTRDGLDRYLSEISPATIAEWIKCEALFRCHKDPTIFEIATVEKFKKTQHYIDAPKNNQVFTNKPNSVQTRNRNKRTSTPNPPVPSDQTPRERPLKKQKPSADFSFPEFGKLNPLKEFAEEFLPIEEDSPNPMSAAAAAAAAEYSQWIESPTEGSDI